MKCKNVLANVLIILGVCASLNANKCKYEVSVVGHPHVFCIDKMPCSGNQQSKFIGACPGPNKEIQLSDGSCCQKIHVSPDSKSFTYGCVPIEGNGGKCLSPTGENPVLVDYRLKKGNPGRRNDKNSSTKGSGGDGISNQTNAPGKIGGGKKDGTGTKDASGKTGKVNKRSDKKKNANGSKSGNTNGSDPKDKGKSNVDPQNKSTTNPSTSESNTKESKKTNGKASSGNSGTTFIVIGCVVGVAVLGIAGFMRNNKKEKEEMQMAAAGFDSLSDDEFSENECPLTPTDDMICL